MGEVVPHPGLVGRPATSLNCLQITNEMQT